MPITVSENSSEVTLSGWPLRVYRAALGFAGAGAEHQWFWPRWLFLRLFGVVFLFSFWGFCMQGRALLGPRGLFMTADYMAALPPKLPLLGRILFFPSLFWINASDAMVTALSWSGLAAALALTLNLWPRAAIAACWILLESLATPTAFTPFPQLDQCLLEATLLAFFIAPGGLRPGLGLDRPPSPIAAFAYRFFVFRVMFEAGIFKLGFGEPVWRDFTAMDIMYPTGLMPTWLAWQLHNMPHWWHVLEFIFTFVAEGLAPILALVSSRGRLAAALIWVPFQLIIWFTTNYGYLNFMAIVIALPLLDDRALGQVLGLPQPGPVKRRAAAPLKQALLAVFLTLQATVGLAHIPVLYNYRISDMPGPLSWLLLTVDHFNSANVYHLYSKMPPGRFQFKIEGSNDGGRTWRRYKYKYNLNETDRMASLVSPYHARFDASLEMLAWSAQKGIPAPPMIILQRRLLEGDPEMLALFRDNPFPDRPPTKIAISLMHIRFLNREEHQRTGQYWAMTYLYDYVPTMTRDPATGAFIQD